MMAPSLVSVALLIALLQLTQQASLPRDFHKIKYNFDTPSKKLSTYSSFNVPLSENSKESAHFEAVNYEELKKLNDDPDTAGNIRTKRQPNQDPNLDAEIISNDPGMLSLGMLMPLTNDDVDNDNKLQGDNEDVDLDEKSKLSKEVNETSHEVEKNEEAALISKPTEEGSHHEGSISEAIDEEISLSSPHHNENESPDTTFEDPVSKENALEEEGALPSKGTPTKQSLEGDNDKFNEENDDYNVMSDGEHSAYNVDDEGSNGDKLEEDNTKEDEASQTTNEENENIADSEVEETIAKHEMEEKKTNLGNESGLESELPSVIDSTPSSANSIEELRAEHAALKDVSSHNMNASFENLDKDDIEMFHPFNPDSSEHSQLRSEDNVTDDDTEEGSGVMESYITGSSETSNVDEAVGSNSIDDNETTEASSSNVVNVDLVPTTEKTFEKEDIHEDEEGSLIPDPTQNDTMVDIASTSLTFIEEREHMEENEEQPLPIPTEHSSVDDSQTHNQRMRVHSNIIGTTLAPEETSPVVDEDENDEVEGSGHVAVGFGDDEFDKDGLDSSRNEDASVDVTTMRPDNSDEEDEGDEEEIPTEPPIESKNRAVLFNAPPTTTPTVDDSESREGVKEIPSHSDDEMKTETTTKSTVEEVPIGIIDDVIDRSSNVQGNKESESDTSNGLKISDDSEPTGESGLVNDKIMEEENATDTSSSSTGSFIVLGAIMVTILILLGYSVIKSYRQKQRNSRAPREEENPGTELKEKHSLLTEKNGHGPGNGINEETNKLLSPVEEKDRDNLKDDDAHPGSVNKLEGNGVGSRANDLPQAGEPEALSEVKVYTPPASSPKLVGNANHVANGVGPNTPSPDQKRQLNETNSPPKDDKPSMYGPKLEATKARIITDHDSIPKTPIIIERNSKI